MILTRNEIKEAVEKGEIRFSPTLEEKQWGAASVDLRLGYKFTKLKKSDHKIPLAKGLSQISNLWHEEIFPHKDAFGKRRAYCIEPDEFILAQTYEHIYIPRNLIARVEGRSTYARVGLSMHETAPWLQPGWDGQITLEIRNSGPLQIELMPLDDMPCQVTFMRLSGELSPDQGYGAKPTDSFQHQSSPLPHEGK
ncbi:MAG: dCTP deaminase [Methylovirgula sp.]